uniref:SP110 nuclear body protein variant 23 n=1 Tax=Sus scrofa TaxID=9823 RepID=S5A7V1_PIG|nr:SP110 nuclear body protein variant 23 [Sus scrofa]
MAVSVSRRITMTW